MSPRLILIPVAALAIAALVACGGDKKKDNKSASNSGSGGTSSSQQASSGASGGTIDLNKSFTKVSDLKSFRYDVKMKLDLGSAGSSSGSSGSGDLFGAALAGFLSDIKAEGAYVAPDKSDVKLQAGPMELAFVQIGDKSWVKFGNNWTAGNSKDSGLGSIPSSPADLFKDLGSNDKLSGAKTSKETVNGVKTTRYSFDKKALESLTKELGQSTAELKDIDKGNLDLWLNEDDVPVKISLVFTGKDEKDEKVSMDLEMNIKDINSNIQIKAPI
jgi:hypothetical protein